MTVLAVSVFFISLVGILSLFIVKRWELQNEVILAPRLRDGADHYARILKHRLVTLEGEVGTWWPQTVLVLRYGVHLTALAIARGFSRGERMMHGLADRVSHKHQFERRETRSQFLKEVTSGTKGEQELDIRE